MTTTTAAAQRYLLLADISGYTTFLSGVEREHGVDFSGAMPAGFTVLGALLSSVVDGIRPTFEIAKLEGDAVFAVAPTGDLDRRGSSIVAQLRAVHGEFRSVREQARSASDELCTACPTVAGLDLKMVLHRGPVVNQVVGTHSDVLGPAVNVAHRLLKNNIHSRFGYGPYLFVTDVAAQGLGLLGVGREHVEEYADVGSIPGRVIELIQDGESTG